MHRSVDRFLTTHTGSLPRPDDLIRMMFAREGGIPVDRPAFAARIRGAVAEVVGKQIDAGIAVVSDGEVGKPSYATYVKDRLTDSAARANRSRTGIWWTSRRCAKRVFGEARSTPKTPACTGPIGVHDPAAAQADVQITSGGARAPAATGDAFMRAASPGVISLFFATTTTPATRPTCSPSPTR